MQEQVRVVVIGGGIVGAAVLYHLTKLGWSDVALVERKQLTAGSTWHAAAMFHNQNSDPNMARLQAYTISVYKEVEKISGQDVGLHHTGGINIAATKKRWDVLRYEHGRHKVTGIDSQLIGPNDIRDLCPIIDTKGVLGALYDGNEGHVDPYGATHALVKSAQLAGAEVYLNTKVEDLVHKSDGTWKVITDKGNINCEHIVNAAGLWAREVGSMAGVHVPIVPMEHHYLLTGDIDEIVQFDSELPIMIDLDGEIYLRQEQNGVLLGIYEQNSTPWSLEGTPWDYGQNDLLATRLEDLESGLLNGFTRYPLVAEAGIRKIVNGPFTFAPDGNPLVGPIRGVRNYWSCCGVMAGFCQGSGIALALSQWMIEGEPEGDIFAMDVNRFGSFATKKYTIKKVQEFYENRYTLLCPNEEWPAARPNKVSAFHDCLEQANAVFGESYGQEVPLWFAPPGSEPKENPSFQRSNSHESVAQECQVVREAVGIIDATSFAKYEISGADAEVFIDYMFASRLPQLGRIKLGPLLMPSGHLKGDLTVMRLAEDRFLIVGSGYLQEYHMLWFEQHSEEYNIQITNRSDDLSGIAISGPRSRELLGLLSSTAVDNETIPFMSVHSMDVGLAPCLVARLSISGELGYEIYTPAAYARSLYKEILDVGHKLDIGVFGIRALLSLRLEKSFGIWSREFSPDYTPVMSGMNRFIDYKNPNFIGAQSALEDLEKKQKYRLVTLEIDSLDADAWGYEPIWHKDKLAGFVTSGGYGHMVNKSLAMGYVKTEVIDLSYKDLSVQVVNGQRPAIILSEAPYNPSGSRMRM